MQARWVCSLRLRKADEKVMKYRQPGGVVLASPEGSNTLAPGCCGMR